MARRQGTIITAEKVAEVAEALRELPGRGMLVVQARAVNKTVRGARTDASRLVRQEIALRAADVGRRMTTQLARYGRNSGFKAAEAALHIQGRPLPLGRYPFAPSSPPSQKGVPVDGRTPAKVQVLKRSGRKVVQHGFIAKMESGHIGIFMRDGEKRKMSRGANAGRRKQPIRELSGPAPAPYFRRDIMQRRLGRRVMPRLYKNLNHELDFYIRQQFRKFARKGLTL